ncbi:N-acetylmuramoyl-L-alanine amidase [Candidatus Sumerlaeota bacterium]|nr:N-acetylmuramoyl-L-alanine amidase [Candidatus Sumerlaeota bacterium]
MKFKTFVAVIPLIFLMAQGCSFFRQKSGSKPLSGIAVCVDAGHGGQSIYEGTGIYTGGAKGVESGMWESDANLKAALSLRDILSRAGAKVVMTRDKDTRVTGSTGTRDEELKRRVEIAEEQGAHILVSLHHNYSPNPYDNGPSVYYYSKGNSHDKLLAEAIHSHLTGTMPGVDHGIHSKGFVILANTQIPSVIIEFGFMSNLEFDRILQDPLFAEREAEAVYNGILKFISLYRSEVEAYVIDYYNPHKEPSPTVETRFRKKDK